MHNFYANEKTTKRVCMKRGAGDGIKGFKNGDKSDGGVCRGDAGAQ